eukprot:NODE_1036_length_1867_cov_0.165158.p1 type:complete len:456 gc:universal NODE_1036_length_1867_cov_0.165158:120-1487(+)
MVMKLFILSLFFETMKLLENGYILIFLRLLLIFSPGIVHPDEYFQSIVPLHHYFWNSNNWYSRNLPWEYTHSARSYGPLFVVYGIPMYILHLLNLSSSFALFLTIRCTMLLWSLILDLFVLRIAKNGYHVYLCSAVTLVFSFRSFSNTVELYLTCLTIMVNQPFLLGVISSIGLFNRITYPVFVAPYLLWQLVNHYKAKSFKSLFFYYFQFTTGVLCASICIILLDTFMYNGKLDFPIQLPVVNNLLYNLDVENLKLHGIHPRWTHFLINVPLVFGPFGYAFYLQSRIQWTVHASCVIFPIMILSLFPHQEPRFLIALFPFLLLFIRTNGEYFRVPLKWVFLHGIVISVFYFCHQGGIIPLATRYAPKKIFFYKTYDMPYMFMPHSTVVNAGSDMRKMDVKINDFILMPSRSDCNCWVSYSCTFMNHTLDYIDKVTHLSLDHGFDIMACLYKVTE